VPIAVVLAVAPYLIDPYQSILLGYGLVMAIAVLGFKPPARVHRAPVLWPLRVLRGRRLRSGVHGEVPAHPVDGAILLGAIVASVLVTTLFGYVCVRYTRIFFSILTLALSQVLWSLAFQVLLVTGGTDGLRVPTRSCWAS